MISSITGMRPDQRKSPKIGPPTTGVAQCDPTTDVRHISDR
jgi:hypothetical protein